MPKKVTLKTIHDFVEKHEGRQAAYEWLVGTVARQSESIDALKKELATVKARITRIRNEKRPM